MDSQQFARNVLQRLNGKPRNFEFPKPTLEALLARIELHQCADKRANYERYRQEAETGKLWGPYEHDEVWCRWALRFVDKAHALGFIDEERYQRIKTRHAAISMEERRAMQALAAQYFPQPLVARSRGEMVYTITRADGSIQYLTCENGTWIAYADFPTVED